MASPFQVSVVRSAATIVRSSMLKPARSPFSTVVKASRPRTSTQPTRPSNSARVPPQSYFISSTAASRQASTTTSTTNPNSTSEDTLTWDRFFELRRKRRYGNTFASALTAGAAVTACTPVIASQDIDGWAAQISGLDPIVVLGLTTFAVAAGGWLCGPFFGNSIFKVWAGRRGWNQAIAEKEKSFFARVRRYRADPSSSSPQNPIPDYYGEKISSVKDYRRWLKDQRAFNLKKNKNMINTTLFSGIVRR